MLAGVIGAAAVAVWFLVLDSLSTSFERHPSAGFGMLLLFVIFQLGFIAVATVFAEPVLRVPRGRSSSPTCWPPPRWAAFLWRRHPALRVSPRGVRWHRVCVPSPPHDARARRGRKGGADGRAPDEAA